MFWGRRATPHFGCTVYEKATEHPPYSCVGGECGATPPLTTPLPPLLPLLWSQPRLFLPSQQQQQQQQRSGAGVWSLSGAHRCAKALDYPCSGEARTDNRGGETFSSRWKGPSLGGSMAVEEEGLRVFQSVKIKIGKKEEEKNPYPPTHPPCAAAWMDGFALTGRTGAPCRLQPRWDSDVFHYSAVFFFFPSLLFKSHACSQTLKQTLLLWNW